MRENHKPTLPGGRPARPVYAAVALLLLLFLAACDGVAQPDQGCGAPYTRIPYLQEGGAARDTYLGRPLNVTVEGVVTASFQPDETGPRLRGFFLQDPAGDGDPATSDGIFVSTAAPEVRVGERVRLVGRLVESDEQTQLNLGAVFRQCGMATPIAPLPVTLPLDAAGDWERYEGMLITFPQRLYVTDVYNLGRFGEFTVAADSRLFQPMSHLRGAAAVELAALNRRRRLLVDDGTHDQYPPLLLHYPANGAFRVGDSVTGLTGVLSQAFGSYRLHPTNAPLTFRADNPRRAAPEPVGGTLKVAAFNVENFFNGPAFPTPRGASSAEEYRLQRDKLVSVLLALDADVIGLMEIENDGSGPESAITNLVNALNARAGPGVYAHVPDPPFVGTDVIKQAILYRPAAVIPIGAALSDDAPIHDRPPIAQTFETLTGGERFTVIVSHFRSKNCEGASGSDQDQDDGQGCFNRRRTRQAEQLLRFAERLAAVDPDVLLIGDLNSYGAEDPIRALTAAGFVDEIAARLPPERQYTYVFSGEAGVLDYALSSPSLRGQVTGVTIWHINADEPPIIGYATGNKPADLYRPDPYRSSDHDPVITGLAPGQAR